MLAAIALSADSRTTAGILLLTIVAVEYGGLTLLRIVRGNQPATEFQQSFARAGHAHAGVLVILALVAQILADAADLDGVVNVLARDGIWAAAALFPAGFFPLLRRPRHHPTQQAHLPRPRRGRRAHRRSCGARHRTSHRMT